MGIFIDSSETAVIGKIGIWMAIPIGGIMGDASSEMSKVIAKAVAFFIYIVFSYIRVSDFRIPLYAWNLLTTDEKKV